MSAIKKRLDLKGTSDEAKARRAAHMRQFSPFGGKGATPSTMTPEEKRAWHSKGGKTVQAKKQAAKTLAELMRAMLSQTAVERVITDNDLGYLFPGVDPNTITYGMLLTASVLGKSIETGRAEQYAVIRDTIGEKPRIQTEVSGYLSDSAPSVQVLFRDAHEKEEKMEDSDG